MKRKLVSGLLCFAACILLLAVVTFADEPVQYLDVNGAMPDCATYKVLDDDTIEWTEGWYIADGTVTIPTRAEVSGNVNLILVDECQLTVKNGICVPEGASLTIFAQSTENAGTLTVTDVDWRVAAIGGNFLNNSGKITINGGNIHTECGMGIGHGYDSGKRTSGEVVINGGNIDTSRINGNPGSPVLITAPADYAMAVRTDDDRRVEGSPFTSETNINEVLNGGAVHIRQVPQKTYNVTVETNGNGTLTANPTSTVEEDAVQLTATPAQYYHFKEWQSEDVTVSKNNTFIMPGKDVTVKAIFEHEPDIPYMDEKGETIYLPLEEVTIFTSDMKELSNKWYLIDGEFTLEERLQVKGDVNIILADGCSLTAKKGINVGQGTGYCYNLTIYAQSTENPGTLTATNTEQNAWEAAIGGGSEESSGQITINGGVIKATTTKLYHGAAAIGGGENCGRGYVTINNGDITAESWYGAAIGGSNTKDDALGDRDEGRGYVTINGGTVKATNHMSGAAIGGGAKTGADVTINGGVITAIGEADAAAIGGAYDKRGFNGKITITGGVINTKTERGESFLTGTGGYVKANLPNGYAVDASTSNYIEIKGSPFLSGDLYEKLKSWHELHLTVGPYYSITYEVQGNGRLGNKSHTIALKGTRVTFFEYPDDHNHFVSCTSKDVQFEEYGALKVFIMPEKDVSVMVTFEQDEITYLDETGNRQIIKDYTMLKEDTDKLEDGWYAVWDKVTIPERIETSGDVHLVLMDGCNLEAQDGIHVGPDSSLTIYSQSIGKEAGKLTAELKSTGPFETWQCAAIGGNYREGSGQITINGGNITAVSNGGAGIGGGVDANGKVTVNNGEVKATAMYGAGIGGGSAGFNLSTVIINGGRVKGESTKEGGGIGAGYRGNANITITGGITEGISKSGEGLMAGTTGKIIISPKNGIAMSVKARVLDIEGSPFEIETDVTEKLKGRMSVFVEPIQKGGEASDVPQTGDSNNMMIWLIAMAGALIAAGVAGSVLYRRKKN